MSDNKRNLLSLLFLALVPFLLTHTLEADTIQTKAQTLTPAKKIKKPVKKTIKKQLVTSKDFLTEIRERWTMQNVALNKLPRKWIVKSGQWQTTIEPEHPGNKVLRQKEIKRTHQLLLSKDKFANFSFSVKLRADHFETKTKNWQMGMVFKWIDTKQFYKLRITSSNIALLRYSDESKEVLPGNTGNSKVAGATGKRSKTGEKVLLILPIGSISDKWHELEVKCYGNQISIKLDGREVRTISDTGIGAGHVGVFTYKTQAFLDDMKLIYLPVPTSVKTIKPVTAKYNRKRNPELLIYYNVEKAGPVELTVLNNRKKLQAVLIKETHSKGLNSITWNGQDLSGRLLRPGHYFIKLKQGAKQSLSRLTIEP